MAIPFAVVVLLISQLRSSCARKLQEHPPANFWSPDCVEGHVKVFNGQFPGPTIDARAGDTIKVELTNKLHTEGIRKIGTPWTDGTASISQCAINPGETVVYRFKVDKIVTPWADDGTASISQCAINAGETVVYTSKVDELPSSRARILHQQMPASELPPPQGPQPVTTSLYYSQPPPVTLLPPEFPFALQPPPAPEFSSPAPSSSILRWLSGLGSAAVVTLLLLGCKMILKQRDQPVHVEMEGAGVSIEMPVLAF